MAEPINTNSLKIRLDPLMWPKALDPSLPGVAGVNAAFRDAQNFYTEFSRVQEANLSNKSLSPSGARAATLQWAEGKLPGLRNKLTDIRQRVVAFENARETRINEWLVAGVDPALQSEIRAWVGAVPETQRASKLLSITEKGDRSALSAVLSAPAYLTGTDRSAMITIRDEMYRRENAAQDEKDSNLRKALTVAERAMDGVIRFVEQETQVVSRQAVA